MPLDKNDVQVIQTEAQILGVKITSLSHDIHELKRVMEEMLKEQIKTNVLLEKIEDNTLRVVPRPRMGGPY